MGTEGELGWAVMIKAPLTFPRIAECPWWPKESALGMCRSFTPVSLLPEGDGAAAGSMPFAGSAEQKAGP